MRLNDLTKVLSELTVCYPSNLNSLNLEIDTLVFDSRKAGAYCMFVCLVGAVSDGHIYVEQAYKAGCRVFVCEKPVKLPSDAVIIRVKNTRKALAELSAEFFGNPNEKLKVIGITGTKGKTTTALIISSILNKLGQNTAYIGSNGVHINGKVYKTNNTTPESYYIHQYMNMMVNTGVEVLVIEVSSQALANYRVYGLKFEATIFTNLSRDHIGAGEHATFDEYVEAKASLFKNYSSEFILYNIDDRNYKNMITGAGAFMQSFGLNSNADFYASDISEIIDDSRLGISFTFSSPKYESKATLLLPGEHNAYNALASIAVCDYLGHKLNKVIPLLSEIYIEGRYECIKNENSALFVIDYAHNEISLSSALTVLRKYIDKNSDGRLICLFGSVGNRTFERREQLGRTSYNLADYTIITSDNPDFEEPESITDAIEKEFHGETEKYTVIVDREKALEFAVESTNKNDIVLVAGKGHEDYQLIQGVKVPFREKEIIQNRIKSLVQHIKV